MNIPIVIVCYNNYKYVENMVNQLIRVNKNLSQNIMILDNKSTCEETINYLKSIEQRVIWNSENNGPWISLEKNKRIYDQMPKKFILTDPDLELNPNLPKNFVEILVNLSEQFRCERIGFALDISDSDKMFQTEYCGGLTIYDWESQFWRNKMRNTGTPYELYEAAIDTTFVLITKGYPTINIRVAGNFTAKHLPWYKDNKLFNIYENFISNNKTTQKISTTSKNVLDYITNTYLKVSINDELFFIMKPVDDMSEHFMRSQFENVNADFNHFLDKNKIFVEFGAGRGEYTLYAARKSKFVYSVESDYDKFRCLEENCKNNIRNYVVANEAINKTTINEFFSKYNIPFNDISIIKANLLGYEENLLEELNNIRSLYNIPILVTFNYTLWRDLNLDRFSFLSSEQKRMIAQGKEINILFG